MLLYFGAAAFLIMLWATRSSFVYPVNNWDDANSYFSVGKALMNGKMPYRDVFDQKGMLLYFLYGLCYLVSHTTFLGVFLMEILWAFADVFGFYKILSLYLKERTAGMLAPLPLALVFSSKSFYWGGAAEEICFPFLIGGLYLGLRYFKTEYPAKAMKKSTLFAAGIFAGMVANIKFTVLGFFFAWMMWVAFSCLIRKDWKSAFVSCGYFLIGMFLPFVPWLLYFGIQGGLYEWYWGYVHVNVFLYSNLRNTDLSIGTRIYTLAKILYWVIRVNWIYFIAAIPGMIFAFLEKGQTMMTRFFVPVLFGFLVLGIYVGGSELPYYALPLGVFAVLGIAAAGAGCAVIYEKIALKKAEKEQPGRKREQAAALLGYVGSVAFSVLIILTNSANLSHMKREKEDIFLYKFRDIVLQSEDPTLLNIGCLDAGLYTVCDIVPTCRWFQTQTINSDIVMQEQERYIREGLIEYVLARESYPAVIEENYELVSQEVFDNGNFESTYYLFQRKE